MWKSSWWSFVCQWVVL
ncbi:hypothetical protein MTR67_030315 [Solanum verrucosum]|uniref:Uncharacterized protein n=1 Tax=Solanum verrucosum TaxID=315347 RepID=A0AAF0RCH8_SOLVR|nr:hypothetical protein MTR67_030315 [Solanum verrucosum]